MAIDLFRVRLAGKFENMYAKEYKDENKNYDLLFVFLYILMLL